MKLNYTIEDLHRQLKKAIYESGVNRVTQSEIIDKISKRGYSRGLISGVFEGNILLDTLSLIDLGVFASEIYKITDIGYINPNIYLTEIEMERVDNYKVEEVLDIFEYPVVFEDIRQVSNDTWNVILPAQFIAKLGRSNMLNYDFETQREATTVHVGDSIILTPTVNPQSIIEIADELVAGTFIPNTLTFNMPLENRDNFKYDKKLKRWILLSGKLNIIDGYHRYRGTITALRKKVIDYNFEVRLTNFNRDKARRFIVQEDKRNPINKEYIKSIDDSDLITQIINQLNESNRSELRGKITSDQKTIVSGLSLVSFEIMHKTIKQLWNPVTIDDSDELFDYLRVFFNRLIGLYPKELKTDIQSYKGRSNINNEKMFVIYLMIAKQIQNEEDWRDILKGVMTKIENNENLLIEYLAIPLSRLKHRNQHIKIANSIVMEVTRNGE